MKFKQKVFEEYQKQAVEDLLRRPISMEAFYQAKVRADRLSASSMQQRIEMIVSATR